jgi:TolB-like protein/tetratricopeptide (TPR) repeat protein
MPFESLSSPGGADYFSRGFVGDLIADLSRFSELAVMAGSAAGAPSRADYLVRGTLRHDRGHLRLSVQLVEARSDRVLWADKLDTPLDRVFEVQDRITAQVVGAVASRINATLLAAARRKPMTDLPAYDAWLRGMDRLREGTVAADEEARALFDQALRRDPGFARAHLGLSLSYFNEWSCQLWPSWDRNEALAFQHAQEANRLDEEDHLAHLVLGRVLVYRREFDRAEAHFDRVLTLNRNDPDGLIQLSTGLVFLGRKADAAEALRRAMQLHPQPPLWYHAYALLVPFVHDDYEGALAHAHRIPLDTMVDLPAVMAVAYLRTGQPEKARVHVDHYLRQFQDKIVPGRRPEAGEALRWLKHVHPYKQAPDEDRLVAGVREAGLAGAAPPAPLDTPAELAAFRKVGSVWQVSFAGQDAHLPHSKGLADLALLLAAPGREIHCSELMAGGPDLVDTAVATPSLDATARAQYEARIRDLQAALDDAEADHDLGRAEALRAELDALLAHLGQALGLGGRTRNLSDPVDRARSAVTQRIRQALRKLEAIHPLLAAHLQGAIRTGTFCCYAPVTPPAWRL